MVTPQETLIDTNSFEGIVTNSENINITHLTPEPYRRAQWYGVAGLALTDGVSLHPATEDSVIKAIDRGSLAIIVDRFDGNFGFAWGFDGSDIEVALLRLQATVGLISKMIGAVSVVETKLFRNTRLLAEPLAKVINISNP